MPLTKQSSALVCTITYNYKIHILADLVICWSHLYVTYTNWYQSQIALITKKSVPPVLQWFQASADRLVGDFQPPDGSYNHEISNHNHNHVQNEWLF